MAMMMRRIEDVELFCCCGAGWLVGEMAMRMVGNRMVQSGRWADICRRLLVDLAVALTDWG